MTHTERLSLGAVLCLALGWASACMGTAIEKPPCDEATLAQIVATCESEADCNEKLDARQSFCAKRISEDK